MLDFYILKDFYERIIKENWFLDERLLKSEISNLQVEKSLLESRIASLQSTRAGEKATLSSLEKKLADERKQKAEFQVLWLSQESSYFGSFEIVHLWITNSLFIEKNLILLDQAWNRTKKQEGSS